MCFSMVGGGRQEEIKNARGMFFFEKQNNIMLNHVYSIIAALPVDVR